MFTNGVNSPNFFFLFSLYQGSLGSVDLQLMKRLVEVLGATRHQYIFSKGAKAEQYELAANMWGDRFLPQTSIIPQVDLVITHGGKYVLFILYSIFITKASPLLLFTLATQ